MDIDSYVKILLYINPRNLYKLVLCSEMLKVVSHPIFKEMYAKRWNIRHGKEYELSMEEYQSLAPPHQRYHLKDLKVVADFHQGYFEKVIIYINGKIFKKEHYKNRKLNGDFEQYHYYDEKKILLKGKYKDGKKHGLWIRNGLENGSSQIYVEKNYIDGLPEGQCTHYFNHGNISSRGLLKNGRKIGTWFYYYENGNKKIEEIFLNDGVIKYIHYYETGNKMSEHTFINYKNHGKMVYYHENGWKKGELIFEKGKRKGVFTIYYENGKKQFEGKYTKNDYFEFWIHNGKPQQGSGRMVSDAARNVVKHLIKNEEEGENLENAFEVSKNN